MKKVHVGMIVLLTVTLPLIHAQQYNQEFLQGKVDKFTKMKTTGITMLATGAASTIGGIVLIATADWEETSDYNGNTSYNTTDDKAIIGMILTGLGLGLTGGGIPLTIIGSKKSQKYKSQLDRLTLVPYVDSNHAGVYLSLRF